MGRVIRKETELREEVFAVYRGMADAATTRRPVSLEEVRRVKAAARLARQIDNAGRLETVIRTCGVGSKREAQVRAEIIADDRWFAATASEDEPLDAA